MDVVSDADKCTALIQHLKEIVYELGDQVPTSCRVILDRFYPHMRLSMAHNRSSEFPVSMRPHPHDSGATTVEGKEAILCFHVGNAILAYYNQSVPLLEARVKLLANIVKRHYAKCPVVGDVSKGFRIAPVEEKPNVPSPKKPQK